MAEDIYFTMTVDTEADNAWRNPDRIDLQNIKALPRFQALCEANGIVPVYLLTYECATRDEALTVIKPIADSGKCEIGYHFHAWTTPPFEKEMPEGVDAKWLHSYQFELPDTLFYEKSNCLLEAISDAYHIKPTVYRAGRWGIDQRTIDWLINHDFIIDSSVLPFKSIPNRGKKNGSSLSATAHMFPFLWPENKDDRENDRSIVEIPLTVFHPSSKMIHLLAKYAGSGYAGNQIARRLYYKLLGSKGQLRPNPNYTPNLVERIVSSHLNKRPAVLNMMIHSSELILGGSPFSMSQENCDRVWKQLESVFVFVNNQSILSLPITEIAKILKRNLLRNENPYLASRFF